MQYIDPSRTEGRRLLVGVLVVTTARELAARLRVAPSRVSEWCSGVRRPTAQQRAQIESIYAVPACTWDQRARTRNVPR